MLLKYDLLGTILMKNLVEILKQKRTNLESEKKG
jgi:hypothetical protein